MPPDVTGHFSTAGGMADVDRVLKIKLFCQRSQVVGVGVHLIAIPGLSGTAVPAPIVRDNPKALLSEKQHLSVPVVRGKRPAVAEHDGLAFSPVLVVNLRAVFHGDGWHRISSLVLLTLLK